MIRAFSPPASVGTIPGAPPQAVMGRAFGPQSRFLFSMWSAVSASMGTKSRSFVQARTGRAFGPQSRFLFSMWSAVSASMVQIPELRAGSDGAGLRPSKPVSIQHVECCKRIYGHQIPELRAGSDGAGLRPSKPVSIQHVECCKRIYGYKSRSFVQARTGRAFGPQSRFLFSMWSAVSASMGTNPGASCRLGRGGPSALKAGFYSTYRALKARAYTSPGQGPGFECSSRDPGLKARSIVLG